MGYWDEVERISERYNAKYTHVGDIMGELAGIAWKQRPLYTLFHMKEVYSKVYRVTELFVANRVHQGRFEKEYLPVLENAAPMRTSSRINPKEISDIAHKKYDHFSGI